MKATTSVIKETEVKMTQVLRPPPGPMIGNHSSSGLESELEDWADGSESENLISWRDSPPALEGSPSLTVVSGTDQPGSWDLWKLSDRGTVKISLASVLPNISISTFPEFSLLQLCWGGLRWGDLPVGQNAPEGTCCPEWSFDNSRKKAANNFDPCM